VKSHKLNFNLIRQFRRACYCCTAQDSSCDRCPNLTLLLALFSKVNQQYKGNEEKDAVQEGKYITTRKRGKAE
jgi:hypothetical protein